MGYKYEAHIREANCERLIEKLQSLLISHPNYEVLKGHEDGLTLRMRHVPLDTEWPEDITFHCNQQRFYVLFHGASGQDREDFLSFIGSVLNAHGVECNFEEI